MKKKKKKNKPETKWSNHEQIKDRTGVCSNILGRLVIWSERLIKLSNSWFFAKSIEVEHCFYYLSSRVNSKR